MGRRLPRSFYTRDTLDVARDLLGRVLCRRAAPGTVLRGRIVEGPEPGTFGTLALGLLGLNAYARRRKTAR